MSEVPGLSLGLLLKHYRRRVGLSQTELGGASGFSAEYVKKIEASERVPPVPTVIRLAGPLMLEPGELDGLIRLLDSAGRESPGTSGKEIASSAGEYRDADAPPANSS